MVGEKLSELLDSKKIKPGTLATLTGIPKSTIYSIIRRNNKNVNFSVMEKISDVLGVPVEYFYDRDMDTLNEIKKEPAIPEGGELTKEEREIIQLFRSVDSPTKNAMLQLLRSAEAGQSFRDADAGDK